MSENTQQPVKAVNPSLYKTTTIYAFLGYFMWPFSLIGLKLEREDDFIRFHCAQGMAFFFLQLVLGFLFGFFTALIWLILPIIFVIITGFAMVASYVFLIIAIIKTANGEKYKILFIGDFAEKHIQKWFLK